MPKARFRSQPRLLRLVAPKPLPFEPGARRQYCNGCYIVLGEIIERLSGMPYEGYVVRTSLPPGGYGDGVSFGAATRCRPTSRMATHVVHGKGGAPLVTTSRCTAHRVAPPAAATQPAADLLAFDDALRRPPARCRCARPGCWAVRQRGPAAAPIGDCRRRARPQRACSNPTARAPWSSCSQPRSAACRASGAAIVRQLAR